MKDDKPYLNPYTVMWIFVFFDLPVGSAKERKYATKFRKKLLEEGFEMMQFSVYTRFCGSRDSAKKYINRISKILQQKGQVSILQVTDKQYGEIINFYGKEKTPVKKPPQQLEMF